MEKKNPCTEILYFYVLYKILINVSKLGCCFRQECVFHSVGLTHLHILLGVMFKDMGSERIS
jgi:hypothetical protein